MGRLESTRQQQRDPVGTAASAALAVLAGVLYAIAIAPEAPPVLAWVALVPLLVACGRSSPGRAALCGTVFAVTGTACLGTWFPGMLERFFGLDRPASWAAWLALALLSIAPPYALACAWLAWRRAAARPFAVGAAWLLAEAVRSSGPVANSYGLLATSQLGTPLAQSADAIGALGVGALVAAGNAVVAALLVPSLPGPQAARSSVLAAATIALAFAYGAWRTTLEFGDGEAVRVALVQPSSAAGDAASLDELLALTTAAGSQGAPELVFWPEAAVGFYFREPGRERERVLAATRSSPASLVLGAPHYRYGADATEYYASAFLVRDGRIAGRYDKRRLVPFAESHPLGGWLGAADARLRPGRIVRPLGAGRARIGAFLCGEVLFADVARGLARSGATVLANPSHDAWFAARAPAQQQHRAAALRAIENRRPLVRATTGGYSAILDAYGAALALGAPHTAAVLEASIRPSSVRTPYQRAGFVLAPAAAAGLVVAASMRCGSAAARGGT